MITPEDLAPLEELYERHKGNLRNIFAELGDDPGKAMKYPPRDAQEFARKAGLPCLAPAASVRVGPSVVCLSVCVWKCGKAEAQREVRVGEDGGGLLAAALLRCSWVLLPRARQQNLPACRPHSCQYLGGYYTYVNMQKIAARISQKRAAQVTESTRPDVPSCPACCSC